MGYLEEILSRYRDRTPTSRQLYEETREHVPGGVASSSREWDPYPFYVDHVEGPHVIDVDGNTYVDYDMNNGAGMTGHRHPEILAAIREQLEDGVLYTMPHELLAEAAQALKDRWPVADRVRFTNSGTESTMHAIRMARAYSGRDTVVKLEGSYHGVHDYVMVSSSTPASKVGHPQRPMKIPEGHGIPEKTLETVEVAPFNDLEAIEQLFSEQPREIGSLIVEPVMLNKSVMPPREEYLSGLRELCDEYGVVLIFDEVKSGVKIAPGGAAEYYDVEPDLVTMAKSIGGELPVGAFGGKATIMEQIETDYAQHYGTYNGNPLVLRALVTALRDVLTEDAYRHVNRLGEAMQSGYEDVVEDHDLTARVESVNSQGMIQFVDGPIHDYRDFLDRIDDDFHRLFWFGMLERDVIPHPYGARQQWTISVQHELEHVEQAIDAFDEIAPTLAAAQQERERAHGR